MYTVPCDGLVVFHTTIKGGDSHLPFARRRASLGIFHSSPEQQTPEPSPTPFLMLLLLLLLLLPPQVHSPAELLGKAFKFSTILLLADMASKSAPYK